MPVPEFNVVAAKFQIANKLKNVQILPYAHPILRGDKHLKSLFINLKNYVFTATYKTDTEINPRCLIYPYIHNC